MNHYIKRNGNQWVIVNKSGKIISRHKTRKAADASFRAMEASKHGATMKKR